MAIGLFGGELITDFDPTALSFNKDQNVYELDDVEKNISGLDEAAQDGQESGEADPLGLLNCLSCKCCDHESGEESVDSENSRAEKKWSKPDDAAGLAREERRREKAAQLSDRLGPKLPRNVRFARFPGPAI